MAEYDIKRDYAKDVRRMQLNFNKYPLELQLVWLHAMATHVTFLKYLKDNKLHMISVKGKNKYLIYTK